MCFLTSTSGRVVYLRNDTVTLHTGRAQSKRGLILMHGHCSAEAESVVVTHKDLMTTSP